MEFFPRTLEKTMEDLHLEKRNTIEFENQKHELKKLKTIAEEKEKEYISLLQTTHYLSFCFLFICLFEYYLREKYHKWESYIEIF